MDTSETYIKMSDCPEIQEQKERNYLHKSAMGQITHGLDGSVYWGKPTDEIIPPFVVPMPLAVWLPRQDQLQEMVIDSFREHWGKSVYPGLMEEAVNFASQYPYPSMEQLWLAFVMKELHSKEWNEGWH